MSHGISEQSKRLHRHLLNHNAPDVLKWMQESGTAHPVGRFVEMTDDIGKQLTFAALEKLEMPRREIPELIAYNCKNSNPMFRKGAAKQKSFDRVRSCRQPIVVKSPTIHKRAIQLRRHPDWGLARHDR